jgi:glycosyltransferase 2 family protein
MSVSKKLIYKIASWLMVLVIFYFLARVFFDNWQNIKNYQFSFDYSYLFLSYLFLAAAEFFGVFAWQRMLKMLASGQKLSYWGAFRAYIYSSFGRYLPGKVWMFMGRVYFAQKQGFPQKPLAMSIIYEIMLSLAAGFLLGLSLLSSAFGLRLADLYFLPLAIASLALLLSHPKILHRLFSLAAKKFSKIDITAADFLRYRQVLLMIFYYGLVYILQGAALFFLINSITPLPFYAIVGVAGAYALAFVSGAVAFFAPDGLGAREGVLALILPFYLPAGIAVLLSLISRIWFASIELVFFLFFYAFSKLKYVRRQ